jgi:hypothetical protein
MIVVLLEFIIKHISTQLFNVFWYLYVLHELTIQNVDFHQQHVFVSFM